MSLIWPAVKDPSEIKDYQINWAPTLSGDTLSTSVWSITEGDGALVIGTHVNDLTTCTIWFSAGTVNVTYLLLNQVTTAGGRTYDQSVYLKCRDK